MRNKATKKNMDLDLRRYGNKLYSKAKESGGDGGDGGGSSSMSMYDAWMKAFNGFKTKGADYGSGESSMPISPSLICLAEYIYPEEQITTETPIQLTFCNSTKNKYNILPNDITVIPLQDVPDDIYQVEDEQYNIGCFLYSLDELNELTDVGYPVTSIGLNGRGKLPSLEVVDYNITSPDFCDVYLINDKYYIYFHGID